MNNSTEKRYRSILVPLDGSEAAEHALPAAMSIARDHGAELHLVRIYIPVAGMYGEHAIAYDAALDRELMTRAREYLEDVAKRLQADGGVQAHPHLLEGPVVETIASQTSTVSADLVVMTTQGRGPLARLWLGSVPDKLVRQLKVPVLLVRPSAESVSSFAKGPEFRRVLIPLDRSSLAERVVSPVCELAGAQSEYTLVTVVRPIAELNYGPAGGSITGFRQALKQLQELDQTESRVALQYLEQFAAGMRLKSFTVKTRVLTDDRPANAILEDAKAHGVDLIALITHGRGPLRGLMLGSVADKVLRGTETPILMYRPMDSDVPGESASTHLG